MPIGARVYSKKILAESHRKALLGGSAMLTDQVLDDIAELLGGGDFSATSMLSCLPRKYLPRYDTLFAKQFLACIMTVSWKIFAPGEHRLACVAEELALSAILEQATGILEMDGEEADFTSFEEVAFEDMDFECLFDLAEDGIEETAAGKQLGMQGLKFDEWFEPFSEADAESVHPFAREGRKRPKKPAKKAKPKAKAKPTSKPKKAAKTSGRQPRARAASSNGVAFHKTWVDQLAAAEGIKEQRGVTTALGYLIGEKLLKFIEASDTRPEFARELPSFVAAIKAHFQPYEIREYLENVKRVGALGHVIQSEEEYEEFRVADSRDNPVDAAEDAILLERAKELLLDE